MKNPNGLTMRNPVETRDQRPFTRRETQIYGLLLLGKSNKEIAAELSVSASAIKFHIANIFEKQGVHGRLEPLVRRQQRSSTVSDVSGGADKSG